MKTYLRVDLEETEWKVRSANIWLIRGTSGELVRSWQQAVQLCTNPYVC